MAAAASNGMTMCNEVEFEYPSKEFFERIETLACALPIASMEDARQYFDYIETQWVKQQISELMTRLKIEITHDFEKHEAESGEVPYVAKYLIVVEQYKTSSVLRIRTALQSKHDHPGRILYGTSIFRIEENSYTSERNYES
jgi:hypothetical protein